MRFGALGHGLDGLKWPSGAAKRHNLGVLRRPSPRGSGLDVRFGPARRHL